MTTHTVPPTSLDPDRVHWGAVLTYIGIAFGLAWLVQLPLWLGDGLASPLFMPLTLLMMYTPTVAALIVTFFILKPSHKARFLGLTVPRIGRSVVLVLLWPIIFTVLGFAAFFLAAAFGWVTPDFTMAGIHATLAAQGVEMPIEAFLITTFAFMHVSMIVSSFAAFGEELGWRGFLVPATSALGFWKGTLFRGIVWGLWHAPIILLGYNFQRTDIVGVLSMCAFTVTVGVLLDWSRYWTRSMWPAVLGHGAVNGVATSTLIFLPNDPTIDTLFTTFLGIPGWIVFAIVIGIMALVGAMRPDRLTPLIQPPKERPTDPAPAAGMPDDGGALQNAVTTIQATQAQQPQQPPQP